MPALIWWVGVLAAAGFVLDRADNAAESSTRLVWAVIVAGVLYGSYRTVSK